MSGLTEYTVYASTCLRDTEPVKSCDSDSLELENSLLKNELCKLKERFENVFIENYELQSKLRDIVCLKCDVYLFR